MITKRIALLFATLPAAACTFGANAPLSGGDIARQDTSIVSKATDQADDYKFRLGGYGEMVASWKDYGLNRWSGQPYGNSRQHHADIAIPRFILATDYKFNKHWVLSAEIEFEAGGTGTEYEIEKGSGSENGEYETETETGGEVALEQFHVTRLIAREFNVRAGHMVVPLGLTNAHHEPVFFFGTRRPEGETTIIPSTWHETGLAVFGSVGRGWGQFDYEAMIVAGANADGFDMYNWIKNGKQNYFETDNFTSPAYVGRIDYNGVPGLRIGGSIYYTHDAGKNSDKLTMFKGFGRVPVLLWSVDAQYTSKYLTARGNIISGRVGNADQVSWVNRTASKNSPYNRTPPVAKRALTYSGELGINLKGIFSGGRAFPEILPFAHYEYYNPQEKAEHPTTTMDKRCQVSMWTYGVNWRVLPNLVLKADYTMREIGTRKLFGSGKYNSENELSVGLAYLGWFVKTGGHQPRRDDAGALNARINALRAELDALKNAPKEKPAVIEHQTIKEVVREVEGQTIHTYAIDFEQGKAELGQSQRLLLDYLASRIDSKANVSVTATASPEGDSSLNQRLSEERATAVAGYLRAKGVKVSNVNGRGVDGLASARAAFVIVK